MMERRLGWELEIKIQSQVCYQQAVKTSLLLGSLFIYYLYLAYFQNRLEVAFNKNH